MSFTHLHLVLNHFPVIGTIIAIALLAYAMFRRSSELSKASLGLFVALGVVSIVVYLTGEPAEGAIEHLPGFSESITEEHEEIALVATIALATLGAVSLGALAFFRRKPLPRWIALGSFAISLVAGGLMGYTALLGGQVRHTEVRAGASVTQSVSQENPD